MAAKQDVEMIGILALFGVLAIWLISAFSKQFQNAAKNFGEAVGGAASEGTAAVIQGAEQAAANVGAGVVSTVTSGTDATGKVAGNWIWNALTSLFPSLADTSADPSQINWLTQVKHYASAGNDALQDDAGNLLWQTDYGTVNGVNGIMSGADYIDYQPTQTLDVSQFARNWGG